jgi:hypothetical protein
VEFAKLLNKSLRINSCLASAGRITSVSSTY